MKNNNTITKTPASSGQSLTPKNTNTLDNHSSFKKSKNGICKIISIIFLLFFFFIPKENYCQIAAWNNFNLAGITSGSINATSNNINLNTSVLSRGSGITAGSQTSGYSSTNWNTSATTEALAITANDYYQCTINAVSTMSVSLTTLDARLRNTATGPQTYIWRYSLDGTNFTDIGTSIALGTTAATGATQTTITLSTITALQNVSSATTIYLRIYAWGATSSSGSFSFGTTNVNSLAIGGTIATTAQNYYWNGGSISASPANGGTGTYGTANAWRQPTASGSQATWTDNNIAYFAGTAGTITLDADRIAASYNFNTSNYVLIPSITSAARTLTGPIIISAAENLTLFNNTNNNYWMVLGSITGGSGSTLTINNGATTAATTGRIELSSNVAYSIPITMTGSGTTIGGIVAATTGVNLSSTITNNTAYNTMIGATIGNDITLNGIISGSAGLQVSAGTSGGTGTITLNAQNTYTGATIFNAGNGTIKLGITNALPTSTSVTMGNTSTFGGTLDMNGFNQTIASLSSNTGGIGSITNNATGTIPDTLTINGTTSPTAFLLPINDGTTRKTSLLKAGSGTLTLSGTNTFTGGTTITSGTLNLNGTTNILAATGTITLNGGTLKTGTTTGFSETVGTLALTNNSTIALGTGTHTITFAASNSIPWTANKTLTITGWTGTYPATSTTISTATAGKVSFTTSSGLTASQIAQIQFLNPATGTYFPATILSTGEIVPTINLILTTPSTQAAGTPFNVTITSEDIGLNPRNVTNATNISLSTNSFGGTITGTTTGTITAGTNSVTISGVIISGVSTIVNITATRTSGDNVNPDSSANFTVTPGLPAILIVSTQPTAPLLSGTTLATQSSITVKDQYGNLIGAGIIVNAAVSTGQASNWTLTGTTSATTNSSSIATFSNLTASNSSTTTAFNNATITFTPSTGTGTITSSPAFIIPAPANHLVITAITPASPVIGTPFSVTIQSQNNAGIATGVLTNTGISLSSNGIAGSLTGTTTGTISANGTTLTLSGLAFPDAATGVTISATQTSGSPALTNFTGNTFTVLAVASQLAFANVAATASINTNLQSFTVVALRPDNTIDINYTGSVTLSKASGSGTLSGTLNATAIAGVATFTNIQFNAADTYTLSAASSSLTTATSTAIRVFPSPSEIYYQDFGTISPYTQPDTLTPPVFATGLDSSSWTCSTYLTGTSGDGGTGSGALSMTPGFTAQSFILTVNVAAGNLLRITSFNFWNVSSPLGPPNWAMTINGTPVGAGIIPTTASIYGLTAVSSPVFDLAGTVTIVYTASGGSNALGTTRIDDFTLYGNIYCTAPSAPVSMGATTVLYNGTAQSINASVIPNTTIDWYSSSIGGSALLSGSITSPTQTNVGTYIYYAEARNSILGCTNVSASRTPFILNITPVVLTYVANTIGRPYGTANPTLTGMITGFVNNETQASATIGALSFLTLASSTSNIGFYYINGSGLTSNYANYIFVQTSGNSTALSITTATIPLTISATQIKKCYGQTYSFLDTEFTVTGLLNNDVVSSVSLSSSGAISTANSAGSPYTIIPTNASGIGLSNYTIVYNNASMIINDAPSGITISSNTPQCSGSTINLYSNVNAGTNPLTYQWSGPNSFTSSIENPSITNALSNASGSYSISVSNGCGSISTSANVIVNNNTGSNNTITSCNTYLWNNISYFSSGIYTFLTTNIFGCDSIATLHLTIIQPPIPIITASGSTTFCSGDSVRFDAGSYSNYSWSNGSGNETIFASSGTYAVTVTDNNGCTASTSLSVVVYALPAPAITLSSPPTFCNGGNVTLDVGNWNSYLWNTGETDAEITLTVAGTYSVTVSDANNCRNSVSITPVVNEVPVASIVVYGSTTFCDGGSVLLNAGSFSSYLWSTGETAQSIVAIDNSIYTVTVFLADGCSDIATQSVTVYTNPAPVITGGNYLCSGSFLTLGTGSFPQYSWSSGATDETVSVTDAGIYTVSVYDANGCMGTTAKTVFVNADPAPIITGGSSVCAGNSLTLNAGPYTLYHWSTNATAQAITVSTSGTYSVTVTNGFGCTGTASQNVVVNANPIPAITANGATTFCSGGSVTLNTTSYSNYLWSTNATSQSITTGTSGNYSVTVTNANGCTGITSQTVTVNSNPSTTITGVNSFCYGGSATLDGGSGYAHYLWNTTSTNEIITVTNSGTFIVTITSSNSCIGIASKTITVNASLVPVITGSNSFCSGASETLDAGLGYIHYLWNNSFTTQTISVTTGATFIVTVTDNFGCTGTTSKTITVNANPISSSVQNAAILCIGGSTTVTIIATGGTSPYTGTGIFSAIGGNYSYTISDAHGCNSITNISITQPTAITFTVVKTNLSGCGSLGSIAVTSTGGTGTKIYSDNGGTSYQGASLFSNLAAGTYFMKVKDANACLSGSVSNIISTNEGITFTSNVTNATTCSAANGKIVVSALGGSGFFNYSKDGGSTYTSSNIFNTMLHGIYPVKVKDVLGCQSSITNITVGPVCRESEPILSAFIYSDDFTIYPNPTHEMVTLVFNSHEDEVITIKMMDGAGRVVLQDTRAGSRGENQIQENIAGYSKGFYILELQRGAAVMQKKIIIE